MERNGSVSTMTTARPGGRGRQRVEHRVDVKAGLDRLLAAASPLGGSDWSGVEVSDAGRLRHPPVGGVAPHTHRPWTAWVLMGVDSGGGDDQFRRHPLDA